jgi:hypothetical protein
VGNATRLARPRTATGDGEGLVSRGGLLWLGEVFDLSGLTAGFSQALADAPRRRHAPGVCLAQMVVALADGADCLSDLEALRGQPQLFGPVAPLSSAQRAFDAVGAGRAAPPRGCPSPGTSRGVGRRGRPQV